MHPERRRFLKAGLAMPALCVLPSRSWSQFVIKADPFTLGVASGDPAPDGFVLWTRLAPNPLGARGGLNALPVEVTYEIARDAGMREVVRSGTELARVELAHSVHVEISGLEPGRDYFYRFRAGEADSPVGRTRTLPGPGEAVAQVRFASAGCQAWEGGHYTAWRAIAEDRLDFVAHYGDYIYENAVYARDRFNVALPRVLPKDFGTCYTLTDYRRRYALYKTDPDLQAAHASCPFLSSFDDHEVANNWASDHDPKDPPPELFLFRRQAAFQAWYEHMPVRRALLPRGPDILAYRGFRIGSLMDLAVLDTRQYRSRQACGDGFKPGCAEAEAPDRTMMGETQERWLADRLRDTVGGTTWQVFANQVLFTPMEMRGFPWVRDKGPGVHNLDAWDGAPAARDRMLATWREARVPNPVVLTGDAHFGMAFEIPADARSPGRQSVGVEFLATSVSSGGDGQPEPAYAGALLSDNPHLKLFSDQRGYTRHTVTPGRWQAEYQVAERISMPGQPMTTRRSFTVEAGRPALNPT